MEGGNSQVQEELPQDREQETLKAVGQDASLESTSEETAEAVGQNDGARSLG